MKVTDIIMIIIITDYMSRSPAGFCHYWKIDRLFIEMQIVSEHKTLD